MRIFGLVPHPVGKLLERSKNLLAGSCILDRFLDRAAHAEQPGIALRLTDPKAEMALAETGMALFRGIELRSSHPFTEILLQDFFCRANQRAGGSAAAICTRSGSSRSIFAPLRRIWRLGCLPWATKSMCPPLTPGRYILLSVSDTGQGMDEATNAHIFEPFFTTKETGKGTGLGLATVYGVVKQSGSFIWVDSSPGAGTIFEIYLPHAVGKAASTETEEKPSTIPGGSETVLVVEDESGVRELACQFLRVKGYNVLEAEGGLDALDVARRHPGTIHLLLSDMVMPKMSGGAAQLKAIRPEIRIAFMSGYSEFSRGDLGKGFPEAPVLQKPFSPASLVEIVRRALARPLPTPAREGSELHVT